MSKYVVWSRDTGPEDVSKVKDSLPEGLCQLPRLLSPHRWHLGETPCRSIGI